MDMDKVHTKVSTVTKTVSILIPLFDWMALSNHLIVPICAFGTDSMVKLFKFYWFLDPHFVYHTS